MRKLAIVVLGFVLGGSGTIASAAAAEPQQARTMDQVIDRVITNENRLDQQIRQYSPLVETYIQNLKPDKDLGYVPGGRQVFPRARRFREGRLASVVERQREQGQENLRVGGKFLFVRDAVPSGRFPADDFHLDTNGFDNQHYKFDYVRREFLGEVRCRAFDVSPQEKSGRGWFLGRIVVEDQDYNIVRFNGAYSGGGHSSWYFHFDSWRTNVQPGMWLPSFIYSEEKDLHYAMSKKLDFKAQTRLWGYNLGHAQQEQELSKILVDNSAQDDTKTANDLTPIQAQRSWDHQAEDNVIDRLERIGLIAPKGEVDKILDTVVNNLEVTNNIDAEPERTRWVDDDFNAGVLHAWPYHRAEPRTY